MYLGVNEDNFTARVPIRTRKLRCNYVRQNILLHLQYIH